MGHISLPSLDDIAQMKDPQQKMEALLNTVGILIKNLSELNGYITTTNVKELHAKVITAGTITSDKIEADSITTRELAANAVKAENIEADAVTADKINVNQLSAISANIGAVNAGSITSNTVINVGTNLNVGQKIYLNASSFTSDIVFNPDVYMYSDPAAQSLQIIAPGGVYVNGTFIG